MVSICKELGEMNNNQNEKYLVEDDICNVISSWTGIPIARMNEDEKTKLLQMESIMHESIVGQEEAIRAIATAIRRNKSGLRDPKKPIASFMFLGSTGVGKTETVKALAKVHYGSEDNIIRLDMSEYMEKHAVSKLIGAPPGYVGHDDGGQLTNAVRTKPYSIVLFDEIEKAHPDVFNMLLQILDDGRLTDSKGRVIDFKNTIIIMTSNLGASLQKNVKEKVLGFGAKVEENKKEFETDHEKLKENILEACKAHFRPEFLNRLDELIVYHNLNEDHVKEIINILTRDLRNRLEEKNITLTLNADVVKYLIKQGTDLKFGARPLARAIQKHLMDGLSTELLSDNIVEGDNVLATFDEENEKVLFEVVNEVQEETEVENSLVD
jgi:ATP-dependent Clp protease ATP-binding subunit ClpC